MVARIFCTRRHIRHKGVISAGMIPELTGFRCSFSNAGIIVSVVPALSPGETRLVHRRKFALCCRNRSVSCQFRLRY